MESDLTQMTLDQLSAAATAVSAELTRRSGRCLSGAGGSGTPVPTAARCCATGRPSAMTGRAETVARTVIAQLAHVYGMCPPAEAASPEVVRLRVRCEALLAERDHAVLLRKQAVDGLKALHSLAGATGALTVKVFESESPGLWVAWLVEPDQMTQGDDRAHALEMAAGALRALASGTSAQVERRFILWPWVD